MTKTYAKRRGSGVSDLETITRVKGLTSGQVVSLRQVISRQGSLMCFDTLPAIAKLSIYPAIISAG